MSRAFTTSPSRRRFLQGACLSLVAAATPRLGLAAGGASRLILLGTAGGPTPKPNRYPAAYALVAGGVTYLIDAGNGVGQQLVRAGLGVNGFRHLFITHHHSDHNADVGTLPLLSWATNPDAPITVWGPPPLAAMMAQFRKFQRFDIATRTGDEGRPSFDRYVKVEEFARDGLLLEDRTVTVRCARNAHPPIEHSYALRFDTPDRSFVFSGDTTYSRAVVDLATGADVLVHEILYLPALDALISSEPNAHRLREHLLASHSTPEQVGRVASEAEVKTLVLSHFVPGGPGVPDATWLEAVRPHFSGEIVVGRDLLEL